MITSRKRIRTKIEEMITKNDELYMYGWNDHDEEASGLIRARCDGYHKAIQDIIALFKIEL